MKLSKRLLEANITQDERQAMIVAIMICKDMITNNTFDCERYGVYYRDLIKALD